MFLLAQRQANRLLDERLLKRDARRGQADWKPREFDAQTAAALEDMVGSGMSKLALRKSPVGVVAQLPSRTITLKDTWAK